MCCLCRSNILLWTKSPLLNTYLYTFPLGMGGSNKTDEFLEKGGSHFQSKNLCCRFCTFKQGLFSMKFEEKNCNMSLRKREGGGQRPFGTFPKNHPFCWSQPSLRGMCINRYLVRGILCKYYSCTNSTLCIGALLFMIYLKLCAPVAKLQ